MTAERTFSIDSSLKILINGAKYFQPLLTCSGTKSKRNGQAITLNFYIEDELVLDMLMDRSGKLSHSIKNDQYKLAS